MALWHLGPAGAAHAADGRAAWLAPSLERIARDGAGGSLDALEIQAARGECESFQIAVEPSQPGPADVELTFKGGAPGRLSLYREHFVHVPHAHATPATGNRSLGPGWYADALIPLAAKKEGDDLVFRSTGEAARRQVFWADICLGVDARPGSSRLPVAVRSGSTRLDLAVRLHVWDFALPAQPALGSLFRVAGRDVAVERELLKHRLMPLHTEPEDQPRLISEFGLKSVGINFWSGADNKHCTMKPPPDPVLVAEAAARHDPRLHLFNYTADEIDECPSQTEQIKAWARALHEAGVDNMITMKPARALYDDGSGSGRSAVDIWVLLPKMYEASRERVQEVLAKGDEVWSYNALVQDDYSPKWEIDFAPINFRIQPGFMNFQLGLTGLLYWQVDRWTASPWTDVKTYNNGEYDFFGEGMLVYPAMAPYSHEVAPSLRLKWIRDGVDDFDYLALLKSHGCTSEAAAIAEPVASSWRRWTHDAQLLQEQRRRLGDYLERVVRSDGACVQFRQQASGW